MKSRALEEEQKCPACARIFTVPAKQKRLRCPHCREIVTFKLPAANVEGSAASRARFPGATGEWRTQFAILEERFEELKQQLESYIRAGRSEERLLQQQDDADDEDSAVAPKAQSKLPAEVGEPTNGTAQCGNGGNSPMVASAATDHKATTSDELPVINVIARTEESATRRLVQTLTDCLSRVGWTVHQSCDITGRCRGGLTLVVSTTLPRERLSVTFNALRLAGFTVAVQVDPQLRAGETLLVVGAAHPAER